LEIVYLGVVPECRGRGIGYALTRQAQWIASLAERERVVLAVDAANRPAISAYETAGFIAWDRRTVLIRDFRRAAKT
jgi:ribosomal protein S18 acetylase RimI-like enzyme